MINNIDFCRKVNKFIQPEYIATIGIVLFCTSVPMSPLSCNFVVHNDTPSLYYVSHISTVVTVVFLLSGKWILFLLNVPLAGYHGYKYVHISSQYFKLRPATKEDTFYAQASSRGIEIGAVKREVLGLVNCVSRSPTFIFTYQLSINCAVHMHSCFGSHSCRLMNYRYKLDATKIFSTMARFSNIVLAKLAIYMVWFFTYLFLLLYYLLKE